jgi:asparagine synthetase B (glutamine-hydrolysing)
VQDAWWPQLHSFAVGLDGSPDLAKAREVADFIGTVHHEIHYTVQEGLDAIRDVIYFIETYDVTTVRASTPMYLLARVIKSMGIKMVLSGEGADEVFGGYLYFHKAPSAQEFHEETVRKLGKLHLYDCLRANKSLSAWAWRDACRSSTRISSMWPCGRTGGQDVSGQDHREADRARGVCLDVARERGLAAEGAVQRRRGLQLD